MNVKNSQISDMLPPVVLCRKIVCPARPPPWRLGPAIKQLVVEQSKAPELLNGIHILSSFPPGPSMQILP